MTDKPRYKRSRQRERILNLLRETDTHPTAVWIYDRLKPEFHNLSMGTVYRNLHILVEQGLVAKIACGSTFDRFDGNVKPHYHFFCEKCGSVLDLPLEVDESINRKVDELTNFVTRSHKMDFFGLCDQCSSRL
ncbi:MAG TPA: transcriptional repressor [Bacillota bacterium]|mgnify:CR=1 FL=1|nr:transcriptional repressor [Bacillota bacterium]